MTVFNRRNHIFFWTSVRFQLLKFHFQNRLDNLTSAFGLLTLFRGFSSMIGPPINGEPVQFDQQSWILIPGWIFEGTNQYNISFFVSGGFLLLAGIISCVVDLLKRKRDRWRKRGMKEKEIKMLSGCGKKEAVMRQWPAEKAKAVPAIWMRVQKEASDQWTIWSLLLISSVLYSAVRPSLRSRSQRFTLGFLLLSYSSWVTSAPSLCCETPPMKTKRNQCRYNMSV